MPLIKVVPRDGVQIRNPDTGYSPLPPAGDVVTDSAYWRMHERFGDVAISPATAPAQTATRLDDPTGGSAGGAAANAAAAGMK